MGTKVYADQGKRRNKKRRDRPSESVLEYVFSRSCLFFLEKKNELTDWRTDLASPRSFFFSSFSLCACWLGYILFYLGAHLGTLDATMLPHIFLFSRWSFSFFFFFLVLIRIIFLDSTSDATTISLVKVSKKKTKKEGVRKRHRWEMGLKERSWSKSVVAKDPSLDRCFHSRGRCK